MKSMPKVEKYMTPLPYTINPHMTIKLALEKMREYRIRHLPVQDGGKLVGLITDRDIKLVSAFKQSDQITVEEAMSPEPYAAYPDASLDQVVFEMAEHKYGCAVIQQENGKVVGIFTAVDGLRTLGEVLQASFKPIQE